MSRATSLLPRWVRGLGAACFLALLCAPSAARADEPLAPQADTNPSVRPSSSARANLLLAGAGVTVGWYGVALGSSYLWSEADHASSLRVPFAGPFIGLAHTGCGEHESPCETLTVVLRTTLSVLSAVGQVGGVAMMMEGLFLKTAAPGQERAPVRLRRADERGVSPLNFSVAPAPSLPGAPAAALNGMSIAVSGSF